MRYVVALDAALRLVADRIVVSSRHKLLAPTLLRSELLSALFASAGRKEIDRREADARLDHFRSLKIRLLGDRVLQRVAWDMSEQLGWKETMRGEYLALTKLQADAFVTLDAALAESLEGVIPLQSFEEMISRT